jgi:replicative DNA helicase
MYLSGGLARRTIGMVAACPGVGKTNTLVNLAMSASLFDYHALVITLEVEGKKIMQRYACMAAGIPGYIMKTPANSWPASMDARYNSLRNERYPAYRKVSISALADKAKQIYLREVEAEIVKWKAQCVKETGSDSSCGMVCVDWVDLLASVGFDKNEPDYKRVCNILAELRKLAVKHDVAMWTATQAKAEAYNRAIIQLNDIAHGFAKAYPLDVSIGIGVDTPSQIRGNMTDQGLEEDPEDPADDKHLVFTVNKNRDGAIGVTKVYQANTLRFFDSPDDAMAYVDSLDRIGTVDPIDTFMLSQRAGRNSLTNITQGFNR